MLINTPDKLDHIVVLRVFAIFLVVLGHATRNMYHPNSHLYSPDVTPFLEILIKQYIYSFHIPLFFWISGYLHHYSTIERARQVGFLKSIQKKIKRLVIPYYSTAFLVLLPTIYALGHPHGNLKIMIKSFLLGHHTDHLWFLPTLFIFFFLFIPGQRVIHRTPWIIVATILFVLSLLRKDFYAYLRTPVYYAIFFYVGYLNRKYHAFLNFLKNTPGCICFFLLHMAGFFASFIAILAENLLLKYFTSFCGIYSMYALTSLITHYLKQNYWEYVSSLDHAILSIYLFHVSVLYAILFVFAHIPGENAFFRVALSFFLCVAVPFTIHRLLSENSVFQFLCGIPKTKKEN